MLRVLSVGARRPEPLAALDAALLAGAAWIDLLDPTDAERAAVEQATGLELRSRADLSEIENSSRLYTEGETLYLSLPLTVGAMDGHFGTSPLGFILTLANAIGDATVDAMIREPDLAESYARTAFDALWRILG